MSFVITEYSGKKDCQYTHSKPRACYWLIQRAGERMMKAVCSVHLVSLLREWGAVPALGTLPLKDEYLIEKQMQIGVPKGWIITHYKAMIELDPQKDWHYNFEHKTISYENKANVRSIGYVPIIGRVWIQPNTNSTWRVNINMMGDVFKEKESLSAGAGACPTPEEAMVMCKALVDYLSHYHADPHPYDQQMRKAAGLEPK